MGFIFFVLFLEFFSTPVKVSCAFSLCVPQKLDRYFHINGKAFLGGRVGVHRGEFREDSCISHGKFSALDQDYPYYRCLGFDSHGIASYSGEGLDGVDDFNEG